MSAGDLFSIQDTVVGIRDNNEQELSTHLNKLSASRGARQTESLNFTEVRGGIVRAERRAESEGPKKGKAMRGWGVEKFMGETAVFSNI